VREALAGLDADHRGDVRGLETTPRVAEKLLHSGDVEPVADLIGPSDGEVLAGDREQAAVLELVLEGFALGFVGLECQVGLADRVGEGFVREIMESSISAVSLSHGSSPWFGLGPPWCFQHLGGPPFL
jgi:hypothetical protein